MINIFPSTFQVSYPNGSFYNSSSLFNYSEKGKKLLKCKSVPGHLKRLRDFEQSSIELRQLNNSDEEARTAEKPGKHPGIIMLKKNLVNNNNWGMIV